MFGIGLNTLVKIGFRVSDHIIKQQEIERSRTASERARLQAEASREKANEEANRYRRTQLEDQIARHLQCFQIYQASRHYQSPSGPRGRRLAVLRL